MAHTIQSERVAHASAVSFTGAKQRITARMPAWAAWPLLILLVWPAVFIYWCLAIFWIPLTWPVRLFTRKRRHDKRQELRHRETLDSQRSA